MIVVSDSSPITNLIAVDKVEIICELFETVHIPPAVHRELLGYHQQLPDFIHVTPVTESGVVKSLARDLDPGESEAIALALQLKSDYLLIDEKIGRSVAEGYGIPVVGLLGVILLAKKRDLVVSVREVIDRLVEDAGFFVAEDIRVHVLRAAGEAPD